MNIKFKSIDIENFRSIHKANVVLENQGTVIVKGVNEYEDKATSNGSGKSSIFEAIIFALFEETSSGEKDVANRIINNGYSITLKLEIDGIEYTIIRELVGKKTSVYLYKNDVDISARNKTDTNKLIIETFGINKNIFLDSVFLSQTVSTNLASLSPTARKERLEILTNTDTTINKFKEQLKEQQNKYETECVSSQMNINKLTGQKDALQNQKNDILFKINEIQQQIDKRNALGNIEDIDKEIEKDEITIKEYKDEVKAKEAQIAEQETEIEEFRKTGEENLEEKTKLSNELEQKRLDYSTLQGQYSTLQTEESGIQKEITRLEGEIVKIQSSDTCPTCGRKYENVNEEHIQKTIKELKDQIETQKTMLNEKSELQTQLSKELEDKEREGREFSKQVDNIDMKIAEHKNQLDLLETKRKNLVSEKQTLTTHIEFEENNIQVLRDKKDKILKIEVGNKEEFENMLKDVDDKIIEIEKQIQTETENYNSNNDYVNTVKHSIQLVTKEFRTYLLQNSLTYLNNLLLNYSRELFSNEKDIIKIQGSDTKLEIKLGDATYESLSGGERTRVNIALLLAQKSLASIIGNISCNIIILDEILGYCDSQAETNVIDLITKELDSLESIYMVSHKEIPIGYDNQLLVIKSKDGLSNIRNY